MAMDPETSIFIRTFGRTCPNLYGFSTDIIGRYES